MAKDVTLIFDIGKTNKKLFLFNESLHEVNKEYIRFDEIPDDDGFSSEDLASLTKWIKDSMSRILSNPAYTVKAINFSTYGASMVHLDENDNIITPFINYLKPFPEDLKREFYEKYKGEIKFSLTTSSPSLGFLNAGLQLYYLKYKKPEIFEKLHQSLHLPQYISYLVTGKFVSEYTSLGCHTGLWDFKNNTYAHWVKEEGFEKYLAPIQRTSRTIQTTINDKSINIGVGVHDSSSALIPYIQNTTEPFILISTGTWSICMNTFNRDELTLSELENDCLNFLGINGQSIKVSRLLLGQEIREQAMKLGDHFNCEYHQYKSVPYDNNFNPCASENNDLLFKYIHLNPARFGFEEAVTTNHDQFESFNQAYHQLIYELTEIQIASLKLAIGSSQLTDIYIDGGFADNEVFIQMLANKLPEYHIYSTGFVLGSALGAALLVNHRKFSSLVLKKSYQFQIHKPIMMTE